MLATTRKHKIWSKGQHNGITVTFSKCYPTVAKRKIWSQYQHKLLIGTTIQVLRQRIWYQNVGNYIGNDTEQSNFMLMLLIVNNWCHQVPPPLAFLHWKLDPATSHRQIKKTIVRITWVVSNIATELSFTNYFWILDTAISIENLA